MNELTQKIFKRKYDIILADKTRYVLKFMIDRRFEEKSQSIDFRLGRTKTEYTECKFSVTSQEANGEVRKLQVFWVYNPRKWENQ